jgi:outer membrane murein-binding lipoprotein Lpp
MNRSSMFASVGFVLIIVVMSAALSGCAQNREVAAAQRENAELRARVATLESQVAQLKDEQARLPITIDGLTLSKLEVGELRLSPKPTKPPAEREAWGVVMAGSGHLTGINTYTGIVSNDNLRETRGYNVTQLKKAGTATTTTTKATSTTTTTPAK